MTDAEVICSFMEPKPTKSIMDTLRDGDPAPGKWWNDRHHASSEWRPRTLTLDAIWEVEERLTDEQWQQYRDEILKGTDMMGLWMTRLIDAGAAQKIVALAAVLRPIVEIACPSE